MTEKDTGKNTETTEPEDGEELEETETDDTEEGAEQEEWAPPTREEWEAQQEAHKAALEAEKAKLVRARQQAKRLREGGGKTGADSGQEGGEGAAANSGEVDVWRTRAVRASAKASLLDRGADSDTVALMLSGLKADKIEFDDEDEPDLEEWLDEMEERYPKLFTKAQATTTAATERPRAGRVDQAAAGGARRTVRPKQSLGEQILLNSQAAAQRGRRGR